LNKSIYVDHPDSQIIEDILTNMVPIKTISEANYNRIPDEYMKVVIDRLVGK
jgi:hypothetical protein